MLRRIIYGIWKRPRDPRPFTLPRSKGDLHPSRGSGKSSLRMHGCLTAHCRPTCSSLAAGVKPACQHHKILQYAMVSPDTNRSEREIPTSPAPSAVSCQAFSVPVHHFVGTDSHRYGER